MPITLTFDDSEVRQALDRLARRVADLRPAMQDIGELLTERTKQRFGTGRAPDGAPWPPNSPVTLARYGGRYGKKARAGRMAGKKPLIGESKALSTTIAYQAGRDRVEVGSPMEYAAVQQFGARKGQFGRTRRGAPIPWGDIPARPFLGVSEADRRDILDILAEHLAGR